MNGNGATGRARQLHPADEATGPQHAQEHGPMIAVGDGLPHPKLARRLKIDIGFATARALATRFRTKTPTDLLRIHAEGNRTFSQPVRTWL